MNPVDQEEQRRRQGFAVMPTPMQPPTPMVQANIVPGTYQPQTSFATPMPPPGQPQKSNRKSTPMGA